jgi:hypothetical protein
MDKAIADKRDVKAFGRKRGSAGGVWSDLLQCFVLTVYYDPEAQCGDLHLPDRSWCDMSGCIALFQRLDPEVQQIQVWERSDRTNLYRRVGKRWEAMEFAR